MNREHHLTDQNHIRLISLSQDDNFHTRKWILKSQMIFVMVIGKASLEIGFLQGPQNFREFFYKKAY